MATRTSDFGVGKREGHDASAFYARGLARLEESKLREVRRSTRVNEIHVASAERMDELEDDSVALMVTSPPYHVGKEYDSDSSFDEYLGLLHRVFAETHRKLQPGGRAVVNLANLGRRPYVPLSDIVSSMMMEIGYHMRGEVIWVKAKGASGSCAWGSWRSPSNPVIRDVHEYCLCFSKGRFDRVVKGNPTIGRDEFLEATLSVWHIPAESAQRVGHPAPFPVELPRRFIELYTYRGELVLDPFIGSGTTAVAAVRSGREWVGYETDDVYAGVARRRIEEARGALAADEEAPA